MKLKIHATASLKYLHEWNTLLNKILNDNTILNEHDTTTTESVCRKLYHLKNEEKSVTIGGVRSEVFACNLTKSSTPPWVF